MFRSCLFILLSMTQVTGAQAAQDYNSSRSNTTTAVEAPEETDKLLEEAKREAAKIVRAMIAADGGDRYAGDYTIHVDVRVSIDRCIKGKSEDKVCGKTDHF